MPLTIHKHFDYLTPFEEADTDHELAEIATLKSSKACSNLEVDALFFARMVEGVKHYEAWRVLGLPSFEAFCGVRLNKTIHEVETIVAGVKALSLQGVTKITAAQAMAAAPRARAAIGGRPPKGENISEIRKLSRGGNDTKGNPDKVPAAGAGCGHGTTPGGQRGKRANHKETPTGVQLPAGVEARTSGQVTTIRSRIASRGAELLQGGRVC